MKAMRVLVTIALMAIVADVAIKREKSLFNRLRKLITE